MYVSVLQTIIVKLVGCIANFSSSDHTSANVKRASLYLLEDLSQILSKDSNTKNRQGPEKHYDE